MRWLVAFFVVVIVGFVAFAVVMQDRRSDYEAACAEADGVPVKSHLGPMVCVDRDALIEVAD